ncbi:MAG: type II toxin-antitoxin system TacA family antitoxin [Acidimicrobiales bacterium]
MGQHATTPSRRQRLEVRVNAEQDALIRQAADLEATTVTAFVRDTVTSRAQQVLNDHKDLVLSNEAYDRFISELDRPARPVPELVELFKQNPKLREA